MGLHVGQFSSPADMVWCLDAVTTNSAQIMGLDDYAIAKGCDASFDALQAKDKIEAIRLLAHRLTVVRKGSVVAKPARVVAALLKEGDAAKLNESNRKDSAKLPNLSVSAKLACGSKARCTREEFGPQWPASHRRSNPRATCDPRFARRSVVGLRGDSRHGWAGCQLANR